jgi:glycosyltransferase involved in cell wall biosynthesis
LPGAPEKQQEMQMGSESSPLVSIVTPVYNNAEHIGECIESVLAQSYQNWDYTIVNNCSTDGSGEIARRYAAKDPRIRVHDNAEFLRVVANHNNALRQISPESKYCKMVFADDWIFPRCIEEMVALAEEHPSVGFVGAYGLGEVLTNEGPQEHAVMWGGLPYPSRLVCGRDLGRRTFFQFHRGVNGVFGTSTSVLYRSDLVRSRHAFYNESNFYADNEACFVLLKTCDYGFVHQVLTFTRGRPGSLGSMAVDMQMYFGCKLQTLVTHGRDFLSEDEFNGCKDRLLSGYYNFLAVSLLRGRRDKKFWDFHKQKLNERVGFSRGRLVVAVLARLCKAVLNPYKSIEKLRPKKRPHCADAQRQGLDSSSFPSMPPSPTRQERET